MVKPSINRKEGDNLKLTIAGWRAERKMSQTELAEAIGRTQKTISAWENGKGEPVASDLYAMEKALKLKPSDRILMVKDLPQR